jgi:hypothetical protein
MKKYHVVIPQGMNPMPEKFELSAAGILAGYFQTDVEFIPVSSAKTPDILIDNIRWEIKSPLGKGKNNIHHQFARAMKQSKNIIIDARRSKMDVRKVRSKLKIEARTAKTLRRLILITKEGKVEVIK